MLEHHVYFWLKDERLGDRERREFEQALDGLLAIDGIVSGHWGRPAPVAERPVVDQSFHYALSLRFESVAAHDAYQADERHRAFVASHQDWWRRVQIYDIE